MTAPDGDFAKALDRAARQARRDLAGAGGLPAALLAALGSSGGAKLTPDHAGRLLAWAGLAGAISRLFGDSYARAGSRVRAAVFQLHHLLGMGGALDSGSPQPPPPSSWPAIQPPPDPPIELPPAYRHLLSLSPANDPRLRALCFGAIETLDERLTMKRYSGAQHRRRQARALLGEPLAWALNLSEAAAARTHGWSDVALGFWDLLHAQAHIDHGWNRIEWSGENPLGGFFSLSDEARPPDAAAIKRSAAALRAAAQREAAALAAEIEWPAEPSIFLGGVLARIDEALARFAESGAWPNWIEAPPPAPGLALRILRLFGRRS